MFYTNKRLRRRDQANRLEKQNHKLWNVERKIQINKSHRLLTRDGRPPTHSNMRSLMHLASHHAPESMRLRMKWSNRCAIFELHAVHADRWWRHKNGTCCDSVWVRTTAKQWEIWRRCHLYFLLVDFLIPNCHPRSPTRSSTAQIYLINLFCDIFIYQSAQEQKQ